MNAGERGIFGRYARTRKEKQALAGADGMGTVAERAAASGMRSDGDGVASSCGGWRSRSRWSTRTDASGGTEGERRSGQPRERNRTVGEQRENGEGQGETGGRPEGDRSEGGRVETGGRRE